ncbi:response regulator transcription factor [Terricaulis silvestris]|uniref:Transcriptional regulatory protein CusR n=1 Tax=Terricaulis silvestris TaxID=2686094 RepID=A0A6I6MJT7_9CAUL|nr:response regulator transcription factor [Terricaulis silvestris]QGZ95575.1 Transcriptional regulatory protein CusR [Terricaulis silvestris]
MRVLLVEDDLDMAESLKASLAADSHEVDHAGDGELGESMALNGAYDVIVLDRMLPKKQGVSIVRDLRGKGVSTPVLILSALHDEDHRIEGLNAGANDYLGKPFSTRELLARVRSLWHGRDLGPATRLQVGDLEMDLLARTVKRDGKKLDLQPREFRLLEYLMRHAGQTVTRKMLLENVWDYHFDPQTNVIDVHISRLRSKIDRDFAQTLLHTVRGSGYRLEG